MIESNGAKSRAAYLRQWRKAHPEKVREYNISYWKRRAERERRESAGQEAEHAEATRKE